MRKSQQTGRLRLRHLLETTEAVSEVMEVERGRFERLAERDAPRAVSAWQLFQTPEPLAERMAAMLGNLDGRTILEPSAGLGRLYRAIRDRSGECEVTLIENAPQCAAELYRSSASDDRCRLLQRDFLDCSGLGQFDCVLMNPPFQRGRDVKHIRHAARMVSPGGVLVSLCYAGTKQRAAFQHDPAWTWEELPADTFRREGTRAGVALVTYRN